MSVPYNIGDLVLLHDIEDRVGVIIDINVLGNDLVHGIVDLEVQWTDGERYWCNAEAIEVIVKADPKKTPK